VKDPGRLETRAGVTMSLRSSETTPAAEESSPVPTLDALYRAHAGPVARWAARLGGPGYDVEDLVHEVFLVVRRRLPEFRGDAKLSTWLYRITLRVALQNRRKERFRRWFGGARRLEIEDAIAPSRLTPVDDLERRQDTEACYRILDGMPDKYRTVLILFELEELSGEEIAALTGLKLATVWVRLHRARARFLAEVRRMAGRGP
jgi:RNA polymerase sigma-70 factor (ECF subfamily)